MSARDFARAIAEARAEQERQQQEAADEADQAAAEFAEGVSRVVGGGSDRGGGGGSSDPRSLFPGDSAQDFGGGGSSGVPDTDAPTGGGSDGGGSAGGSTGRGATGGNTSQPEPTFPDETPTTTGETSEMPEAVNPELRSRRREAVADEIFGTRRVDQFDPERNIERVGPGAFVAEFGTGSGREQRRFAFNERGQATFEERARDRARRSIEADLERRTGLELQPGEDIIFEETSEGFSGQLMPEGQEAFEERIESLGEPFGFEGGNIASMTRLGNVIESRQQAEGSGFEGAGALQFGGEARGAFEDAIDAERAAVGAGFGGAGAQEFGGVGGAPEVTTPREMFGGVGPAPADLPGDTRGASEQVMGGGQSAPESIFGGRREHFEAPPAGGLPGLGEMVSDPGGAFNELGAQVRQHPFGTVDQAVESVTDDAPGPFRSVGLPGQPMGMGVFVPDISEFRELGEASQREVTPHIGLSADQRGVRARAEREEIFAERAESGIDRIARGGLPTEAEAGAIWFQGSETLERVFVDMGADIREDIPLENVGPTVGANPVGAQVENLIAAPFELGGMGLGSVGQLPVTGAADIQRDATVEQRDIDPLGPLAVPEEVERGTTADELAAEIASRNSGVEPDELAVTGSTLFGFDIESNVDPRERLAAREGVSPQDIAFDTGGDPFLTVRSENGITPTKAGGGAPGLFGRAGARTAQHFAENPIEAAAVFLPIAGKSGRAFEAGAAGAGATTPWRPTVQRFELGEAGGISVGATRFRGKVQETQPVLTAGRGFEGRTPFETGTPEVPLGRVFGGRDVIPSELSAAETSSLARAFREAGRESEATRIEALRETQARTQQSQLQPENLEPVVGEVLEQHGISGDTAPDVLRLFNKEGAKLYGSVTQRAAAESVSEPGLSRTPRDIDVGNVADADVFGRRATELINEAAGEKVVRLEEGTPTSVETGGKLFDIHEAEAPPGSGSLLRPPADLEFGILGEPDIFSSEGVRTTTLSHQTGRKGISSIDTITREPREMAGFDVGMMGPQHAGRLKDIPDFFLGERANIEALRTAGRTKTAAAAERSLNQFVEAFGEDMAAWARREHQSALEGAGLFTELADFGASPSPPTTTPFGDFSSPALAGGAATEGGVRPAPSPSPGTASSPSSPSPSPIPGLGRVGESPFFSSPGASESVGDATFIFGSPVLSESGGDATSIFGLSPGESPIPGMGSPERAPADASPSTSPPSPSESPNPFVGPSPIAPSPGPSPPPSAPPSPPISPPGSPPPSVPPSVPSPPPSSPPGPPYSPPPPPPSPGPSQSPFGPIASPEPTDDDDPRRFLFPEGTEHFNPVISGTSFLFGGTLSDGEMGPFGDVTGGQQGGRDSDGDGPLGLFTDSPSDGFDPWRF